MHPLAWLGIVLLVLWAVLRPGFAVVGGMVHLLAVAGLLLLAWRLVTTGVRAVDRRP